MREVRVESWVFGPYDIRFETLRFSADSTMNIGSRKSLREPQMDLISAEHTSQARFSAAHEAALVFC